MLVSSGNGITVALMSITFDPLSREHAGLYVLRVGNSAGIGSHSFTVDVQCKYSMLYKYNV